MDGSPSSVLTLGLGSWSSSGLLLTLGFGQGAVAEAAYSPPAFTLTRRNVATLDIERLNVGTLDVARRNVRTLEVER